MRIVTRWVVAVLAVVAVFVSAIAFAQSPPRPAPQPPLNPFAQRRLPPGEFRTLSGPDVGFRIEGSDANGRPTGRWMVRMDGEWVEPAPELTTRRLSN